MSDEELSDEQLEELSRILDERRAQVEAELATAAEDAKPVSLDTPIGRLSRMDAIQQQHMAGARKARLEGELNLIKAAQSRVRSGDYGACARCEEPIGYPRLKVRPEAPLCRACQDAAGR